MSHADAPRDHLVPHRPRPAGLVLGVLVAALLVPLTPAGGAPPVVPQDGALFGAFVKPETGPLRRDVEAAITDLERDLGVKLGIDQHFFPWGTRLPGWQAAWDVENGRIPLVTWGDVDVAAVNAGTHDAYIADRADAVKAVGAPVQLRWFAEMDGGAKRHLSRSPSEYIAAWKRIHGIFAKRGATNVEWVWCPNAWGFTSGENAPAWYPGEAYVDWLCADGYNWAPGDARARWRSFAWVFQPFYDWGIGRGKPMMVGETGVQERLPGEKPAWIAEAATAMKTLFPEMKAFVYFDENRLYDWRIRTSDASVAAFRAMAQDPYFRPDALLRLDVQAGGDGTGSVWSDPAGIDCGSSCSAAFEKGSPITLTAVPSASSTFAGWTGDCSGTLRTCGFAPDEPASVNATFTALRHKLVVERIGTGGGTISGPGISCPPDCSERLVHGTSVRLAASPETGSAFAGWGGACAGSGLECVVTAVAPTTVGVIFDTVPVGSQPLTLIRSGTPGGSVTATPGVVDCAMTCVLSYESGEAVTVSARPDPGSSFVGWSGDCAGAGTTCSVRMDQPRIVEAGFAPIDDVHQPVVDVEQRGKRHRRTLDLTVINHGNVPDAYVFAASRGSRRMRVRYFAGGTNVTGAAVGGSLVMDHLAPGGSTDVMMVVSRKGRAGKRSRGRFPLAVRSLVQPAAIAVATPTVRLRARR